MRACPETIPEILDILGTYGEVRSHPDPYDTRYVYVLYHRDGVYNAHGYTRLTAAKSLYRKTYERMFYFMVTK
jgi:hypothetical protein